MGKWNKGWGSGARDGEVEQGMAESMTRIGRRCRWEGRGVEWEGDSRRVCLLSERGEGEGDRN